MKLITTLILTTLLHTMCVAQGTLLFIDGRKAECTVVDYITDTLKVNYKLTNKSKERSAQKNQLFSYTPEGNNEIVFYKRDTLEENQLTINEMRMHMFGQQDARKYYKTPLSIIGGAVFGVVSGYFTPPLLSPLGIVPFVVVNGLIIRRISRNNVYNKLYLAEESYQIGYKKTAKYKRIQQSLVGGIVGLALGIVANCVVNSVVNK